ncbi:MAG: TetR/AcrR family transcriptional regulator [Polyangiaceae bacterium]|nr:TetR/AcrR family transcriptional regulator [Polyangiaceae bacterium]
MTARARVKKRVGQLATETYREAILEAAERAFLGAGYHQAKMSDVAREAGVSIGTLYNYFDSKEQVFSSLVEAGRAEFLAALDVVDPSVSPLERAFAIVRSAMDHIEERGELFAMYVQAGVVSEGDIGRVLGEHHETAYMQYLQILESALAEAQTQSMLRGDVPAAILAGSLAGNVNAVVFRWMRSDRSTRLMDDCEIALDLFLRGAQHS